MNLPNSVTVAGAGLAGALMTILLARRNVQVTTLERRADLRKHSISAGRSINLALAERGIHALKTAGVFEAVQPLLIPMPGRMVHDVNGQTRFLPYSQYAHEQIYSVSRAGLNAVLLDRAESLPGVSLRFEQDCTGVDFAKRRLTLRDGHSHRHHTHTLGFDALIGADGAASAVRQALIDDFKAHCSSEVLPHGYKELTMPPDPQGHHPLERGALHIWPRGGFMLIALPNLDGSFTVTLFLPFTGAESFASLRDAGSVTDFFSEYFPDAMALMPQLTADFFAHPTGKMTTVRTQRWTDGAHSVLIGDAAHAIVPFHGQGMNCAFEDCVELDRLLSTQHFAAVCQEFERRRKPNAEAIANMALENYIEMRDTVREPKFLLKKELAFELERRFPERFIPRYSMVMFRHDIPYATAYARGRIQSEILQTLTAQASTLGEVDMESAAALVQNRLSPL